MPTAFLGLGSNIGEAIRNLRRALDALRRTRGVEVVRASSVYISEPIGSSDQPDFANAVAMVRTDLSPRRLLDCALRVEKSLGRDRTERWGPRVIDIDILLYDGLRIEEEGLTIPHPRMAERLFVLAPLAEIAPETRLNGRPVGELAADLEDTQRCERLASRDITERIVVSDE